MHFQVVAMDISYPQLINVTGSPPLTTDKASIHLAEDITVYLHGVLGVAVMVTNILVVVTHVRYKKTRTKNMDIYVLYLAVADFLVGLFILFLSFIWGILSFPGLPRLVCHIWSILKQFSIVFSALIIILLSYDRLLLVMNPFRYHRKQRSIRIHALILTSGLLCLTYCTTIYFASFLFVVQEEYRGLNFHICIPEIITNASYLVIVSVLLFFIPFTVLVSINVAFFWKLVENIQAISKMQRRGSRRCFEQRLTVVGDKQSETSNEINKIQENVRETMEEGDVVHIYRSAGQQAKLVSLEENKDSIERHTLEINVPNLNVRPTQRSSMNCNEYTIRGDTCNPVNTGSRREDKDIFKENRKNENAKLRHIAKKLSIYVGIFLLCWLPFEVSSCLPIFGIAVPHSVINITGLILLFNSLLNPIIYAAFKKNASKK